MPNRLAQESSPYLRQHAGNPVDWHPWGEAAFAQAREQHRPVLLSVGYSACHWCHVMAHECFEDAGIARQMNDHFISIKVDREERPDVDSIYMQAVQAMAGHGGWPMTVFLTPEGVPFFGGTYFPPHDRDGMRGFDTILSAVAEAFHARPEEVAKVATEMRELLNSAPPATGAAAEPAQLEEATLRLLDNLDWQAGGFGGRPKFPHPSAISLLLRRWHSHSDPRAWDGASVCLDGMARGGLFDQLAGGFHRYCVDSDWTVPHFEKMLYDNAQLAPLYVNAYQLSGRQRWRRTAEATYDYMISELRLADGGFAASQDADSKDGEGAAFVWTPAEISAVLTGDDAALAMRLFGVTETGNTEGGRTVLTLPQPLDEVARDLNLGSEELETHVDSIRRMLLAARRQRPQPALDDKVLCSWNALAIGALAQGGAALGRADYLTAARGCADFVLSELVVGGVPLRSWHDGQAGVTGFLEDVSYLGNALLTLYEACGEVRYYTAAVELAEQLTPRFGDGNGGLYDTASDSPALLVRPRTLDDNPLPAGQSVAATLWLRLHRFTGLERYRDSAERLLRPMTAAVARSPLAVAAMACAVDLALGPWRQVAVVGDTADSATQALVRTVWSRYDPHRVLAWGGTDTVPLLSERPLQGGRPTAYVCEQFVCSAPTTDNSELRTQLEALGV